MPARKWNFGTPSLFLPLFLNDFEQFLEDKNQEIVHGGPLTFTDVAFANASSFILPKFSKINQKYSYGNAGVSLGTNNKISSYLKSLSYICGNKKKGYMKQKELLSLSIPQKRYNRQLEDIRWKLKANNIRKRDENRCQICGATNVQLDVHHLRYIDGRQPWDYDDGDLVTLCHNCHERLHRSAYFYDLNSESYFYDESIMGVGIIEKINSEKGWFNVCWADDPHYGTEGHGRLYIGGEASPWDVRKSTNQEIEMFWSNVERYYDIEYIVETFNKWIRLLLPKNHTLRQKAHQCFVQSIKLFNEQKAFVKKHYEYFLLVSEKYFADFYNIREERRSLILPCLEHGSVSRIWCIDGT